MEPCGKEEQKMNSYIKENFDTGFLNPQINFALFCLSFIFAAFAFVWEVLV